MKSTLKIKSTTIQARLMAWRNRLKQRKHLKKYKQRNNACNMASYKMVDWCVPEDEKKTTATKIFLIGEK